MSGHRKILIVAYPGQGHINPALQLSKRLLTMGVDVTFSTSLYVIRCIDKQTTPHGLTFAPFSDGHDNGQQPNTTLQQYVSDFATNGAPAVAEIISSAAAAGHPFDHLVYTTALPWAARVANIQRIKSTILWCQSATIFDLYCYYFNGYQDFISSNNSPSFTAILPGLPPLTTADLPSFFLPSSPKQYDFVLPIFEAHIDVLKTTPRILINTFDELEIDPIRAIEKFELLPVGPLLPSAFLDGRDPSDDSFGGDIFQKPKEDYFQWLDKKPKSSVVYVSFGSLSILSKNQAEEMAIGLLNSRRPFLWVMRDVDGAGKLSKMEELKKQGMIVSWCSQVKVLNHQAIGCFVTHCGWNSTMEALAAGVPMVSFPQWSDQATNGKMMEDVWKTGVRVRRREGDGMVEGRELERCLSIVMREGEKGKVIRRNAKKWRCLAKQAVSNGGSSTINLQAFLDDA